MGSKVKVLSALMLVLGINGCGGGGANNDAGMSFTLNGFNAIQNNACTLNTFVTAIPMPISGGGSAEQSGSGAVGAFSCFNVQNNLVTQSVRVDRAMMRYFVAGASSQPPSTVTAAGVVLGAASGATSLPNGNGSQPGTKPGGTLPSGGTGGTGGSGTGSSATAPRATAGFAVVPAAVAEWISSHRSELPEPPFEMVASVTVSGITSAGNRIETNELPLSIIVSEDNIF